MRDEPTIVEGRLIDAHYELLQKVWGDDLPLVFNHAILAQVSLPFRNPGDDVRSFARKCGSASIQLEAGALPNQKGDFEPVGMPYGPRARLVLIHLVSEAIKQRSPIVELEGGSFTSFASSLGISTSGRDIRSLKEQVKRMSVVNMRLAKAKGRSVEVYQGRLFRSLRAEWSNSPAQRILWPSHIEFSTDFYESLTKQAVPLRWEAVGALKHTARALDVYCWLSHRLWRVKKNTRITYRALQFQFGDPEGNQRSFQRAFDKAMKQALMVYPGAHVDSVAGGIVLKPSRPAVPFKHSLP